MEPIRTLDEVDDLVCRIESGVPQEAEDAIARLVASHEIINLELGRGSVFWRARRCPPSGFPAESSMSYPPPAISVDGRCSSAGEPSLYLSARRQTALAEIGSKGGEYVQLSGFQVQAGKGVRLVNLGELHHVQKRGTLLLGGPREAASALSEILNSYEYEKGRLIVYQDAVLAGLLGDAKGESNGYQVQRAILKAVYKKLPALDGILYPSMRDALGVNFAVRGPSADRLLESCCSLVVQVTRARRHGTFDFEIVRVSQGVEPEGDFQWKDASNPGELCMYRLTREEAVSHPESLEDLGAVRRKLGRQEPPNS